MEYMEVLRVQHNKQKAEQYQQLKTEQPVAHAAMLEQKAEQYQQFKTEQPKAYAAKLEQKAEQHQQLKTGDKPKAYAAMLEHRAEQEVERYRQLKTDKPKAYAAKLDAAVEQYQQLKTDKPKAEGLRREVGSWTPPRCRRRGGRRSRKRRALAVYTALRSRARSANRFGAAARRAEWGGGVGGGVGGVRLCYWACFRGRLWLSNVGGGPVALSWLGTQCQFLLGGRCAFGSRPGRATQPWHRVSRVSRKSLWKGLEEMRWGWGDPRRATGALGNRAQ
jgi:hypothetical protein